MNLTNGNRGISSWKRIKVHYLATAGAVALAASVVLPASFSQDSSGAEVAPAPARISISASDVWPLPSFIYYLVRTQQEAAVLNAVISTEDASFASLNTASREVVVVDSPEAEARLNEAVYERWRLGTNVRALDLRGKPETGAASAPTESKNNAQLEVDIWQR